MDKVEASAFVEFQKQPLKKTQIISRILLMLVISIPCGILGVYSLFTSILFLIFDILFIGFAIGLLFINKEVKYQNLFIGAYFIYISVILVFASYKFLCIHGGEKLWVILLLLFILLANIVIFQIVIKYNINRGVYSKQKPANKNILAVSLGGSVLAFIVSRYFTHDMSQNLVELILAGILFFLALLCSIGSMFLYKAYLQYKFKL